MSISIAEATMYFKNLKMAAAQPGPLETFKMENFTAINNGIVVKLSILDVCMGPSYTCE